MKYFIILFLICFSTIAIAVSEPKFWEDCPGPACPADKEYPQQQDYHQQQGYPKEVKPVVPTEEVKPDSNR
jgi:hypothetical protein